MPRVIVIGGGAAGVMAAIFSASAGADTLLLERTEDGGRKILISGGGRCNILPLSVDDTRFVTDSSPNTLRKILRSWPLAEQILFFEREAGIPLKEETESAKLFPKSESARDVRDRLFALARARGVKVETASLVADFSPSSDGWSVRRHGKPALCADAVIVATGGLSVPKTGSDGTGLAVVERLGHTIHRTYAALTPLVAGGGLFTKLAGISLPVGLTARAGKLTATSHGGFLFTHNGYSGPSVLDVSHVAARSRGGMTSAPAKITVRWTALTENDWDAVLRKGGTTTVLNAVGAELPWRLAEALLDVAQVNRGRTVSNMIRAERLRVLEVLTRFELPWTADEGYRKAEVTGGGVALSEINPSTMESKLHPGLFLCGEMLDAFGPIGGYNFLWAWVTGRAAGLGAGDMLTRCQ